MDDTALLGFRPTGANAQDTGEVMSMAWRLRMKAVATAAAAALAVAAIGGTLTDLGPWYQGLAKPSWQPPDWLFPVAWTAIFSLTAAAGVLAWQGAGRDAEGRAVGPRARESVILAFTVNAFLNVLWSLVFFRLRRPDWALAEVAVLWLSIVVLIVVSRRHSTFAAWLLVPYLAWVACAAALNAAVVRLNGPFG
jgi:tryptophan-rich sensory protein